MPKINKWIIIAQLVELKRWNLISTFFCSFSRGIIEQFQFSPAGLATWPEQLADNETLTIKTAAAAAVAATTTAAAAAEEATSLASSKLTNNMHTKLAAEEMTEKKKR